ncbi:MAG: nucleotidyl transferase AbiEii/AbiGii toxin family protein [Bacteroidota bacterium]
MMDLKTIQSFYPVELQREKMFLLREYLQYEILKLLFEGKYAHKYTFLGGTCLRICYGTNRFSEDLDFDNVGLTEIEFEETAALIKTGLELLGYTVAIKFTYKGAFHCHIKFPSLLYHYDLSGHKDAKLLFFCV